ncbi:lmo0937 family membrane protein [Flavobacterium flavipallidum]|uniref:Lmo0937 family membrane protein n=1 Tax=Flavobacterium flavipallidum TaxID=3139140 RepID=A0ABU9HNZ6_9FLAO
MGNLLYLIAILLVVCWALGFFVYSLGSLIHLLLIIAIIAVLMRIIKG